jgi:hypothetical protein
VPVTGDFDAPQAAVKLSELLADLTAGLSAGEIHAVIAARLDSPEDDPRLSSLVADGAQFSAMWTALAQGESLPARAWETVVLPALIAFSGRQTLKADLERATSLWLATQHLDQSASGGQAPVVAGGDARRGIPAGHIGTHPVLTLFPTDDLTAPATTQFWPRSLVALALVALTVTAGFWWLDDRSAPSNSSPQGPPLGVSQLEQQTPSAEPTGAPVGLRTPGTSPVDPALPSTLPPPSPTWSGPGPAVAPTAPTGLTVRETTSTTVGLAWLPPAEPGSGQIAYYRIFRDGADAGWTAETRVVINRLMPGARYAFHVIAYNEAGMASPSSDVVTATTTVVAPSTGPPPARVVTLEISPQTAIILGDSFAVVGSGWPCSAPAGVRISLGGQPVAVGALDAQGAFTARIAVDSDEPATPHVHHAVTGEPIVLTKGIWLVTAELAGQATCTSAMSKSAQVNFRMSN